MSKIICFPAYKNLLPLYEREFYNAMNTYISNTRSRVTATLAMLNEAQEFIQLLSDTYDKVGVPNEKDGVFQ